MVVFRLLAPPQVFAYIDPGSGSYFAQLILGILLGASFFWKSILGKIKALFSVKQDNVKRNTPTERKSKSKKSF